ncbi:MAG TPA: serine hydrolase domain-containing protein [Gemmatimonadales bacterium]|nr:serine hydrolase domain-containing protein [Gemmatimonadales bacterium]
MPLTRAPAAATTGFAWGSASPESQGMCGSALQLGCTRTLADIWGTISAAQFNTMRFIVIRNDKVVYDKGGTVAYPAYSANKGLLGAPTLVHAMSSCSVGLSDPAAQWLAAGDGARWATTWPWTDITVEQLATHTSGVCDYGSTSTICRNENKNWQRNFDRADGGGTKWVHPADIFTIARAKAEQNREPAAVPGTVVEYSSVGHALLNYVVQQACGQSLSAIYSQYIRQAGMGLPVAPAQIYTDGGRIWNQSAGIARWKGRDGAAVLRLAARSGIWDNRNVEPVRYWNLVTRIDGNLPAAVAAGRGVVFSNNGADRWTATEGHRRWSRQLFGHNGNYSTIFLTDPLTATTVVRQGKNNATGASYLTLNGCQPGWTGTAPSCTPGTDWSNNWGVAATDEESATIGPRAMVMDPVQEAFFFPPPFCRITAAGGTPVDQTTDVYDSPAEAGTVDLEAEIQVNPREGDGASVPDRVEFYRETGVGAPTLAGMGSLIGGTAPARYLLSINPDRHGVPGSTVTYFASCVARSTADSASQVPSYSRPVRVRRGV